MLAYMTPSDAIHDDDEIHQEEVIREKLEQLGTTAARHVWKDVCTEASAIKYRCTILLEWLFPIIIVYQQDSSRFYQDLHHVGIAFVLLLWGCFVLAPQQTTLRGKTVWNQSCNWISGARKMGVREDTNSFASPSPGESAAGSGSQVDDVNGMAYHDDETDEERFEKFYASLEEASPLRRLVLPPSCRLVEKPRHHEVKKQQQKPKNKNSSSEEDNPERRLSNYCRQFVHLIRSIFWFDFVGAGWTLISWLQGIQRYRKSASASDKGIGSPKNEIRDQPDNRLVDDETDGGERSELDDLQSPRSPQYHPTIVPEASNGNKGSTGLAREPACSNKKNTGKKGHDGVDTSRVNERRHRSNSESSDGMDHSLSTCAASQPKKDALDAWRKPSNSVKASLSRELSTTVELPNENSLAEESSDKDEPTSDQEVASSISYSQPQHANTAVGAPSEDESSGPFYFDTEHSDMALRKLSIDVPVPDRNGYILDDQFLSDPKNSTPLLVFVNSRSGPQQGHLIITQLRRLLNPIQIWDLANGGPEAVLESFVNLTRLRILVCGGDGTVSWIISSLEKMELKRKWPPIAILPLGTGNDLARVHGWGGGYNNESLLAILVQISESYTSLLDRWDVTINNKQSKKKENKCFMNYLGVGADAQAALQVHNLRESRPDWFFSRILNKVWYGIFGAEDIIMASSVNVRKDIRLVADGVPIPLPPDSQGIILLNIDSYAGGVPMWSHGVKDPNHSEWRMRSPRRSKSLNSIMFNRQRVNHMDRTDSADDLYMQAMSDEERYEHVTACDRMSSCQDGILEIVSIRGAFHLGQIRVGLGNAQRLGQCREAVITIKDKVAVQIDGEPWKQRPCTIKVVRKPEHAVMLHRSMDDGGIEAEMSKLLDFAEERQLITRDVHAILMKEFSRRIENLTRQRRVREQDNIMITLKKAISQNALGSNNNVSSQWSGGIAF